MTRRAVPQTAIRRAIKAAEAQGLAVTGVEISPEGAVRILTAPPGGAPLTDLERWRARYRDAGRAA